MQSFKLNLSLFALQLFMACRVAVEAEALHNVIEGLSRRMQQRADEMRVLITQKKAEISALVQDALRRGNDDEILTLHRLVPWGSHRFETSSAGTCLPCFSLRTWFS